MSSPSTSMLDRLRAAREKAESAPKGSYWKPTEASRITGTVTTPVEDRTSPKGSAGPDFGYTLTDGSTGRVHATWTNLRNQLTEAGIKQGDWFDVECIKADGKGYLFIAAVVDASTEGEA